MLGHWYTLLFLDAKEEVDISQLSYGRRHIRNRNKSKENDEALLIALLM